MFSIFKNSCYREQYIIQLFCVVASKATILKVCAEPLGSIARERHFAELVKDVMYCSQLRNFHQCEQYIMSAF